MAQITVGPVIVMVEWYIRIGRFAVAMVSFDMEFWSYGGTRSIDLTRGRHAKRNTRMLDGASLSRLCSVTVGMAMLTGVMAPVAHAAQDTTGVDGYVVSSRSFPKASEVRANPFAESVSVDTDDGEWSLGGSESSIGENLGKQAEDHDRRIEAEKAKKAEAERQRKAEQERKRQEEESRRRAEEAAKREERSMIAVGDDSETRIDTGSTGSHAASRSSAREAITDIPSASSKGSAIADGALSLVGGSMDCTMLATLALQKGTGIYFHGWPEDYRNFPGAVETSWGDAKPGDILVYRDGSSYDMNGPGHADHVAIYIGNGMAVHGGWNGGSVAIARAVTSQGIPEHVYRVM